MLEMSVEVSNKVQGAKPGQAWCEACQDYHDGPGSSGYWDKDSVWHTAGPMVSSPTGGLKGDGAKLRMDLIDPYAMEGLAQVLTFGAKKYGDRNWEKGIEWSRIFGAILRHLGAIQKGEDYDTETGLLHSDHLMTNAMFLSRFMRTHRHLDDRPSSVASGVNDSLAGLTSKQLKKAKKFLANQQSESSGSSPAPSVLGPSQNSKISNIGLPAKNEKGHLDGGPYLSKYETSGYITKMNEPLFTASLGLGSVEGGTSSTTPGYGS